MFDCVLVANRGEIAVRVIRTLSALGIRSVGVYSDADADALHVVRADVSVRLGPAPAVASYLSIERILDAARTSGAQAIHPGYGFLSESAAFARACVDAGIVFIGPPPEAMEAMGDKIRAKRTVAAAGVPVVPGVHEPGMTDDSLMAAAVDVGYPMMVKAAAGGGGKGMRVVRGADDLPAALAAARRESRAAFGDDDLLLERYLERPRHIEVQVLADTHGLVVHLGERECSLQRRHQKVVEECPSPLLDRAARARMGAAAVEAARSCGYVGAGTVEFIVPGEPEAETEFFFLEMNTRLQVEHPVTEEVYGLDLVEEQVRIAAGEALSVSQSGLEPHGWAVEARVYAEDPGRRFLPTGGTVLDNWLPTGDGLRVDTGIVADTVVGSDYDPLLAKVIGTGPDRATALRRLRAGLSAHVVLGVVTNTNFLRALLDDPDVRAGRLDTGLIERRLDALLAGTVPAEVFAAAGLARLAEQQSSAGDDPFDRTDGWRVGERAWSVWRVRSDDGETVTVRARGSVDHAEVAVADDEPVQARVQIDAKHLDVWMDGQRVSYHYTRAGSRAWLAREDGDTYVLTEEDELSAARAGSGVAAHGPLVAPMPGTVVLVDVQPGDRVVAGQALLVVEAMKMEHPVVTSVSGTVTAVHVTPGQPVAMDEPLAEVEADADAGSDNGAAK